MKSIKRFLTINMLLFGLSSISFLMHTPYSKLSYVVNAQPPEFEDEMDEGDDGVPVDNYLWLLPVAGIAVGAYFLRKRQQRTA